MNRTRPQVRQRARGVLAPKSGSHIFSQTGPRRPTPHKSASSLNAPPKLLKLGVWVRVWRRLLIELADIMSLALIQSLGWTFLSMTTGRGAVTLTGMLIANHMGASEFAAFSFIHVTATSISAIATIGMQSAVPRYFAMLCVDDSAAILSHVAIAFSFACFGLCISIVGIFLLPEEVIGLQAPATKTTLAILLLAVGLNNLFIEASSGLEQFSDVSKATIVQGGLLLIAAALAIHFARVELALMGYFLATLTSIGIMLPGILKPVVARFQSHGVEITRSCVREVSRFCGPLFFCSILPVSGLWLSGRSLLGRDDGILAFAEFAMGLQWFALGCLVPAVVGRVILPRISRLGYLKDTVGASRTIRRGIALSAASTLILLFGVFAFSDSILSLYGGDLKHGRPVLLLFVLTAVFCSPIDILGSGLIAINRQMTRLYVSLGWWTTLVGLLLLLDTFGAAGAAAALATSYLAYSVAMLAIAPRCGLIIWGHSR